MQRTVITKDYEGLIKCKQCLHEKSAEHYTYKKSGKINAHICKPCFSIYKRNHRQLPKSKLTDRAYKIMKAFGITMDEYNRMFKGQNGKCALCKKEQPHKMLAVDHCHSTGKIRSLLCSDCNAGLGFFKENIDVIKRAAQYLKFYAGDSRPYKRSLSR